MRRPIPRTTLLLTGLLLLTGCADRDPYRRTDVWRPTGANAANLAAMVANPHDLAGGQGSSRQLAKAPERAVEHIWTGAGASGALGGGAAAAGGGGAAAGGGGASTSSAPGG